jgi:MFS family permease
VLFFLNNIFDNAGSEMDSNLQSIIVGIVQVVATMVSSVLVDRAGRKILLTISDVGMAVSLVALGIFFYLKDDAEDPVYLDIGWLPLISMIIFITAFSLGFGPIPWMLVGEILPARALGTSFRLNLFVFR